MKCNIGSVCVRALFDNSTMNSHFTFVNTLRTMLLLVFGGFFSVAVIYAVQFFFHWAIYLSHSHSHTFSMSCERYSASIVIIIPNTTCNVCFFFIRFTVKIHTFRKPKKQQQMNGFPLSRPVEHHSLTKTWKLPKTFPRCNNCHVQYPFLPCLWLLSFSLLIVLICRVISRSLARSLSVLCNQLFNYFVLYSLYDFPSSQCRLPYEISSFTWKWHNITLPVTYTCCSFRSREKKRQHERIWHRQQHQQTFQ